jgi:hypothetical protein
MKTIIFTILQLLSQLIGHLLIGHLLIGHFLLLQLTSADAQQSGRK